MIFKLKDGWSRNCRGCGKTIIHKGRYSKYVAKKHDKYKKLCRSCSQSGENHPNFGNSSWSRGLTKETDERIKKMSESVKLSITPELIEKNKKFHTGRKPSLKTKMLWSFQRSGKGNGMYGKHHKISSKQLISNNTKNNWMNGVYKFIWKSNGQKEIENILRKLKYKVKAEYYINGKPYDIFVEDKNLIIEFNGTYWHCDPRFYSEHYYNTKQKMLSIELWNKDKEKIDMAKRGGYNAVTIWQKDWENCYNKEFFLQEILVNY